MDDADGCENALYDRHPEFETTVPRWNLIERNLPTVEAFSQVPARRVRGCRVAGLPPIQADGLDEAFSTTVLAYQWALGQGIDKTWLDAFSRSSSRIGPVPSWAVASASG